jgi:hypothetical protein
METGNHTVAQTDAGVNRMVRADEIRWTLDPRPRVETLPAADLLALEPDALLEYPFELQQELAAVRGLMHETFATLARVTDQRDRALFLLQQVRRQARTGARAAAA